MTQITWALPWALLLLLGLPLHLLLARRRGRTVPLPRTGELAATHRAGVLARLPDLLRILCLAALVLAIAGPSTAGAVIEERREGNPIVLAIDISSSMLAQDFLPRDRLEVAKTTISRFIESRDGDPI